MHNRFGKGLLIGSIIGGMVTLFATSEKTKEMRGRLKDDLDDLYDTLVQKMKAVDDLSKEYYDRLVERVVDEYSDKKNLTIELKENIAEELKNRWIEAQVAYLYFKVRSKLRSSESLTKEKFYDIIDQVYDEFAEKREITRENTRKIIRKLKDKWSDYKLEIEESDHD